MLWNEVEKKTAMAFSCKCAISCTQPAAWEEVS